jgi:hypothetical protein
VRGGDGNGKRYGDQRGAERRRPADARRPKP